MDLEDIQREWENDGKFETHNISQTLQNIYPLHNKYMMFLSTESLIMLKQKEKYKQLTKLKTEYYRGELSSEELKELGWKPFPLKILKQDIQSYIDADQDISMLTLKIGLQKAKVDYLESIIRMIANRGYTIKTLVDWEKFKMGA